MAKEKYCRGAIYECGTVYEFIFLVFWKLHDPKKEFKHLFLPVKRLARGVTFSTTIAVKFDIGTEQCFQLGSIFRLQRIEKCIDKQTIFGWINGFEALSAELFVCAVQELPAVFHGSVDQLGNVMIFLGEAFPKDKDSPFNRVEAFEQEKQAVLDSRRFVIIVGDIRLGEPIPDIAFLLLLQLTQAVDTPVNGDTPEISLWLLDTLHGYPFFIGVMDDIFRVCHNAQHVVGDLEKVWPKCDDLCCKFHIVPQR